MSFFLLLSLVNKSQILNSDFLDDNCVGLTLYYIFFSVIITYSGFPDGSEVKASASNAGDPGSIPGSGRSPGEGNGNPFQYSCLENPIDLRSLVGCSPRGHKESDTTERLHPSPNETEFMDLGASRIPKRMRKVKTIAKFGA